MGLVGVCELLSLAVVKIVASTDILKSAVACLYSVSSLLLKASKENCALIGSNSKVKLVLTIVSASELFSKVEWHFENVLDGKTVEVDSLDDTVAESDESSLLFWAFNVVMGSADNEHYVPIILKVVLEVHNEVTIFVGVDFAIS